MGKAQQRGEIDDIKSREAISEKNVLVSGLSILCHVIFVESSLTLYTMRGNW